ncbi:MAG: hypothetical protein U0872_12090 [Planctomycetaceae bacterium]
MRKLPFRWGGALLVFAAGGWLLSRCVGWWVGPRREPQHEQVAWLVFGLVWWLCWSPSIVGFAIIASTLFRSLWRRRSPPQMAIG